MAEFSKLYYQIREKEGRNYTDEALLALPAVDPAHQHFEEWKIRASSANRIIAAFRQANHPLHILDLGCGNGWFSHKLAEIPAAEVLGMDLEGPEICQASRVFAHLKPRLRFSTEEIFSASIPAASLDRIVLGASIQYFPDLRTLVTKLQQLLKPNGEIHIFDSPFYADTALEAAADRTAAYYAQMGFPELAQHYHHHRLSEILTLGASIQYNPHRWENRIQRKWFGKPMTPFYWLVIQARQ